MTEFSTANFWKLDKSVFGKASRPLVFIYAVAGLSYSVTGHPENIRETFLYFACIVVAPSHQPFSVSVHFQKLLTR